MCICSDNTRPTYDKKKKKGVDNFASQTSSKCNKKAHQLIFLTIQQEVVQLGICLAAFCFVNLKIYTCLLPLSVPLFFLFLASSINVIIGIITSVSVDAAESGSVAHSPDLWLWSPLQRHCPPGFPTPGLKTSSSSRRSRALCACGVNTNTSQPASCTAN